MSSAVSKNAVRNLKRRLRRRGFTLVELMAVVLIIGILAAVASPAFVALIRDSRVNRAALELADMYRRARSRALGRGTAVMLRWTAAQNLLELREAVGGSLLPAASCTQADFTNGGTGSQAISCFYVGGTYELADVAFVDTAGTTQGTYELCFSPHGRAFQRLNSTTAFTPFIGVPSFTVTNHNTGRVRTVFLVPNGVARIAL